MKTIQSILTKHGFGKVFEQYKDTDEACQVLKEEILGDKIDLNLSYRENEDAITDLFWEKNGLPLRLVIRDKEDVKTLYELFQEWCLKTYKGDVNEVVLEF